MYAPVIGMDGFAAVLRPSGSPFMSLRRPDQSQGQRNGWVCASKCPQQRKGELRTGGQILYKTMVQIKLYINAVK